jgi:hypothetical protein
MSAWARLKLLLVDVARHLARLNASDRPWEMPLAAAAASGLPVFIGVAYGRLDLGLIASLGGLAFLYLPATALSHRMAWLMACAFGLVASYTLGILSQLVPAVTVPMLAVLAIAVTMICRFYAVPPPGSLFFVMAAAIGAYTPAQGLDAVTRVGLVGMGCVLAVGVALVYSLHQLGRMPAQAVAAQGPPDFDFVVLDAFVIGGVCLHSPRFRQVVGTALRQWLPARGG